MAGKPEIEFKTVVFGMYVVLRYSSTETCIEEDDEPKPPKSISIFLIHRVC